MIPKLIIRPEAKIDLAEAKVWYDKQRKGLASEFRLCVEEAMERIRRMPELHAELHNGIRRCSVRRFPYAIYYKTVLSETSYILCNQAEQPLGGGLNLSLGHLAA